MPSATPVQEVEVKNTFVVEITSWDRPRNQIVGRIAQILWRGLAHAFGPDRVRVWYVKDGEQVRVLYNPDAVTEIDG